MDEKLSNIFYETDNQEQTEFNAKIERDLKRYSLISVVIFIFAFLIPTSMAAYVLWWHF